MSVVIGFVRHYLPRPVLSVCVVLFVLLCLVLLFFLLFELTPNKFSDCVCVLDCIYYVILFLVKLLQLASITRHTLILNLSPPNL